MASKVIHGEGKPMIKYGSGYTNTITLPYCMSLREGFTIDALSNKIQSGDIWSRKKGWYYKATLDYEAFTSRAVLESMEPLFNITNQAVPFKFYPRSDNTNLFYYVDFEDNFQLSIGQLKHFQGHKGVVLKFRGTQRLSSINLTTHS